MRCWLFLLASAMAAGADCSEVWRQIRQNQPAQFAVAGCGLNFHDRLGKTPLIVALESNADLALIRKLLLAGADVNFSSKYGNPPLVWAIIRGPQAVRLLLAHGAKAPASLDFGGPLLADFDVTRKFAARVPALYFAAWLQQGAASELYGHGVRLDPALSSQLLNEMTSLRAVDVEILLRAGFDMKAKNPQGQTLLHQAVNLRRRDLIALLLKYGASPKDRNAAGQTVEVLARSLGRMAELACLQGRACP